MKNCIFCNVTDDDSVIDPHHVCWSAFNDHSKYITRSWKQSLTIPLCRTCHNIYHESENNEDFINKLPDYKREIVRKKISDGIMEDIEDAILLSHIIPLLVPQLCGHNYYYVKKKLGNGKENIDKLKTLSVKDRLYGNRRNGHYLTREEKIQRMKDNDKIKEIIKQYIIKYHVGGDQPVKRTSHDALYRWIESRRCRSKIPHQITKKEFKIIIEELVATGILIVSYGKRKRTDKKIITYYSINEKYLK